MTISLSEFIEFIKPTQEGHELWYLGLGFAGETGEAVDEIKKRYRDRTRGDNENFLLELGDSFHYFMTILGKMGWTLEDVMTANVKKLEDRRKNGKH